MDYYFNECLDTTLQRYFDTYEKTVDTMDYVPDRHVHRIHSYIFKNLKREFKLIKRLVRKHKKAKRVKYARALRYYLREARRSKRREKRAMRKGLAVNVTVDETKSEQNS